MVAHGSDRETISAGADAAIDAPGALVVARVVSGVPNPERGLDRISGEYHEIASALIAVEATKRRDLLRGLLKAKGERGDEMREEIHAANPSDDPLAPIETAADPNDRPWPRPLAKAAYYGPLGELVLSVAPMTEADPAAILLHLACATGIYLGPNVFAKIGVSRQPARFDVLVLGPTGGGRKGTGRDIAWQAIEVADPDFARKNLSGGLSSGEGLIWAVRDPIWQGNQIVDPGIEDKSLLVIEPEFTAVLRVAQRTGSRLSAVIRQAWDGDVLSSLTKNSPARATGAHIGLIGHATPREFLSHLDRGELAGGTVNRFLLGASRRPRLVSDPPPIPDSVFQPFAKALRAARAWIEEGPDHVRVLFRDDATKQRWAEIYPALSADRPGMYGEATARAATQVVRLTVLLAALDRTDRIQVHHQEAALAIWAYCQDTARWLFGDSTGSVVADGILKALQNGQPMSKTDIHGLFGRHESGKEIDRALHLLESAGLAMLTEEKTAGRPRHVWSALAVDWRKASVDV